MPRFLPLQGALALLLVLEPACRKRQVAIPVPPQPAASQPQAAEPSAPASQNSSTPQTGPATTNSAVSPYQVNKPAQPAATAPPKSSGSVATPSVSPSAPATAPSTATPVQPPQLGDIVTPDQQRKYNAAIDQSLSRAQASLATVANRVLSKDQQRLVEQIRNIMQQAQVSRNSDLPGAKSLAQRAEVLAKDLAGSFR
jgi:hypothetical protein